MIRTFIATVMLICSSSARYRYANALPMTIAGQASNAGILILSWPPRAPI